MRCFLMIMSALALATALPSEFAPEESFLEAQNTVESMIRSGKDDAACRAVADDLENVVTTNVEALQKAQKAMDNGSNCKDEGQEGISAAKKTLASAETARTNAQGAFDRASNAAVDFGSRNLNTLTETNCGTFFNSDNYKNAVAARSSAKSTLDRAKGAVTSAEQGVTTAEEAAKKAVKKCKCDIFKNHKTALATHNSKVTKVNQAGWTKAAHLKCVLAGTAPSSCTVPPLPQVKAVTLCTGCDTSACEMKMLSDNCGGFRLLPKCGNNNVAMMTSLNPVWDRNRVYACKDGWYWASSTQYKNIVNAKYGCNGSAKGGYGYYAKCGWSGYKPPNQNGASMTDRTYFRFSDSKTDNSFQHVGIYIGTVSTAAATSHFAGIVCIKNGH